MSRPNPELSTSIFGNGKPFIRIPGKADVQLPSNYEVNSATIERREVTMAEPVTVNNIRNEIVIEREADPNGITQHQPGAKMDAGKAPVFQGVLDYFPRAIKAVSMVSLVGSKKYAWKGWESVPDGFNRYSDALGRHLVAEAIEGPVDADTTQFHAAQVAWNALARLELFLREQEKQK